MASTATKTKSKSVTRKQANFKVKNGVKTGAKGERRRPLAKAKSTSSARLKGPPRGSAKNKPAQVIERKGLSAKVAAAAHESVFHKMLGRIKPLFRKPLDPRVKHMVDVFGERAVKNLIAAFRNTRETAADELTDALERAEALAPPPAHGAFVWHELMTRDVPAARRFYTDMFGWSQRDVEMMPDFNYTIMRHISKDVAGLMAITPEQGDMQPGWLVYVAVDDVDSAADKAEALGGEIVVPAHDIPVGRWAMLKDPGGAVICVYKARV